MLEFTGEEGHVYAPQWVCENIQQNLIPQMMDNLNINLGDHIKVRTVDLIDGKFVKLQPKTKDFLDISNPKAVYVTHRFRLT